MWSYLVFELLVKGISSRGWCISSNPFRLPHLLQCLLGRPPKQCSGGTGTISGDTQLTKLAVSHWAWQFNASLVLRSSSALVGHDVLQTELEVSCIPDIHSSNLSYLLQLLFWEIINTYFWPFLLFACLLIMLLYVRSWDGIWGVLSVLNTTGGRRSVWYSLGEPSLLAVCMYKGLRRQTYQPSFGWMSCVLSNLTLPSSKGLLVIE